MSVYEVERLMAQTRRLAAEYYQTTQQTLPVSSELARFDAMRLLKLSKPEQAYKGVDALDGQHKIQIKGRVIFNTDRKNYRLGQINREGDWNRLLLVLFNNFYEPMAIYACDRAVIEKALDDPDKKSKSNQRGAMSVAKFKAISMLVWSHEIVSI